MVIENTHEAIIDKETWDLAQKLRETNRRTQRHESTPNRLTGLLYCADCGAKMSNDRSTNYMTNQKRNNYLCSAYRRDTTACTIHYIRSESVENTILNLIEKASVYARYNETDFIRQVREISDVRQGEDTKIAKKTLLKNQRRCSELDRLIKKLYEDRVFGILSEKRFEVLVGDYEKEQGELEKANIELKAGIDKFTADNARIYKFIELVKKYADFTEITTPMLYEFVDKVVVYERNRKKSSTAIHRIDIYLNFIGLLKFPKEIDMTDTGEI